MAYKYINNINDNSADNRNYSNNCSKYSLPNSGSKTHRVEFKASSSDVIDSIISESLNNAANQLNYGLPKSFYQLMQLELIEDIVNLI